jgi:hypothetical protein
MSFESITKQYLKDFQKIVRIALSSGAKSTELATRPIVHSYINDIFELCKVKGANIVIHHDTNYTKYDRPDWRIEDAATFGVFCFGDHKSLNASAPFAPTASERSQFERYLSLGRPIFVFDGIEFVFYQKTITNKTHCSLIPKPTKIQQDWATQKIDITAEAHIRNILCNPGFRKWTESHLVEQLATRARFAADEIAILLSAPVGSGVSEEEELLLKSLHKLRDTIAEHHDQSLRDTKSCADFVVQVLTFGLFYAHTRHTKSLNNPTERIAAIRSFWSGESLSEQPDLLRPFKAIITFLSSSLKSTNILSNWYEEILAVLAHAEYMGTDKGPQDFHALFEHFLTAFDHQSRFDRGAFYTPKVLTGWAASACDHISKELFGMSIMEAAEKIIDPCCGTAGFLEAIYSLRPPHVTNQASLIGFEILPAPYALAHYRLAELFDGDATPPQLKIILTDTLADQLLGENSVSANGFGEELNDAIQLCNPPLRLVIGNPPSSNSKSNSAARTAIEAKLSLFRPPTLERTDRQNIQKALKNEAYRFLIWCAEKAIESGNGILALVLPGAFARSVSFKYARKWVVDHFQKIYVLEVDGDARKGDSTQSVFSVLQGRLVIIAIRYEAEKVTCAEVYHRDISAQKIADKIAFLSAPPDLKSFSSINPTQPSWILAPTSIYPEDLWKKGWPLTATSFDCGIFAQKCSGVKLAPSAMLFHSQRMTLIRRSLDLSRNNVAPENLIAKWFSGQQKRPPVNKLTPSVKVSLRAAAQEEKIAEYLFRPFVYGSVLNSDQLFTSLKRTEGGGVRDRPEVRSAFQLGAIGIAVAPAPSDLGNTLTRFACFAWCIPDNDIAARGNAMIYCDRFPEKSNGPKDTITNNVSQYLLEFFNTSYSPAKSVLFYTYAVLSSPSYLDTFEGALYSPSNPDSPPRILISSCEELRRSIAEIGEKIAECEKPLYNSIYCDSIIVDWPDGYTEFNLSGWDYVDEDEKIILLGDQKEIVTIYGVSQKTMALRIAGHTVLEKWLRERRKAYLTRKFTIADAGELRRVIGAICEQSELIDLVDNLVQEMIDSEMVILPPPRQ